MSHDLHDDVFDQLRKGIDTQPFPNDATRVGRGRQKLSVSEVARDVTMQTGRGLAQAGLETVFFPATIARMFAKGSPVPAAFPLVVASTILDRTGALRQAEDVKREEATSLDMFYGRPQSTEGRAARMASQLVGEVAMIPMGGLKPKPRFPIISTDAEVSAVAEAMRRAPPSSKERRLLEDLLTDPERTARGAQINREARREAAGPRHTPPSIRDLEELMNRAAFGRPKGPFVHPERRVPVIGARTSDEALVSLTAPRSVIEAARMKAVEDAANAALRDAILENSRLGFTSIHGVIGKTFIQWPVRLNRSTSIFNFGLRPGRN